MDVYIGTIYLFAGNFAPANFDYCEGQLLQIKDNTALFTILGVTYGGDGNTTFALPDLRHAEPKGKGAEGARYIICMNGVYPPRH